MNSHQTQKLLLLGNHSCANRGDLAILRGLICEIQKQSPDSLLTVWSRHSDHSPDLYQDHPILQDSLQRPSSSFWIKLKTRFEMLFVFFVFLISPRLCPLVMSKRQKQFSEKVRNHDKIIQVGGSFFVDSYGPMQFEYILISLVAKKPTYLVGHSYGPFNTFLSRLLAKTLLSRVTKNFYREQQSAQMLTALGIDNAEYGVDTAWLVPSTGTKEKSNCVALTLRELSPFDRVLGFSQQEFEDKVTSLAQSILNLNYKLIFVSTCTSLGGYWKDDRVVAKRVAKRLQLQDRVQVIEDDLNDIDIGRKLSECVLTIGTRLHSAIISMNFGTPAYTIYYEPKSLGIMERVIDADHCLLIPDLDLKNTLEKIESTLNNIDKVEQQMAQKVIAEKAIAKKMITSVLEERDD